VSWVGFPRIILIPFSWLGGSGAQNHEFFFSGSFFIAFVLIISNCGFWIGQLGIPRIPGVFSFALGYGFFSKKIKY
jgi:hypothetical protein